MSLSGEMPPGWSSIAPGDFLTSSQLKVLSTCSGAIEIEKKVLEPDWPAIEAKIKAKNGQGAVMRYIAYALEHALSQSRPAHRGGSGGAHV